MPAYQPDEVSSTVQWEFDGKNNVRTYYCSTDKGLVEGVYSSDDQEWKSTPLGFKGRGVTSAIAHVSPDNKDYQIIVVFGGETCVECIRYSSKSAEWTRDNLSKLRVQASPRALIKWSEDDGLHLRFYYCRFVQNPSTWEKLSGINGHHEFGEAVWSPSAQSWSHGNGGSTLARVTNFSAQPSYGSCAAVAWKNGQRISFFYWGHPYDTGTMGRIYELRWNAGWHEQPKLLDAWDDLPTSGALSAISWVDASGVDQLRLYASYRESLYEYQAGKDGWIKHREDLASKVKDSAKANDCTPLNAVVWTYPNADSVHVRLNALCAASSPRRRYVKEILFDTGIGWTEGISIAGQGPIVV